MVLLAALGQACIVAITVVLANRMTAEDFEAYAAAAAIFLLAMRLAPLGVESLALRIVGPAHRAGDAATIRGFARFAAKRALAGCMLALAAFVVVDRLVEPAAPWRGALVAAWIALPFGVLAQVGFDLLTAAGKARLSAALLRIVVPGVTLAALAAAVAGNFTLTGARAIAAWTLAWIVAVALQAFALSRALPRSLWSGEATQDARGWQSLSRPLFLYQLGTGAIAQAPTIALVALDAPATVVGAYVAASTCIGFLVVIGAAANRLYARELAVLIDRGDLRSVAALKTRRLHRMALPVALVLLACLAIPERMLDLFRPDFAHDGAVILRVLSLSAAFTLAFALAPTYLNYRGHGARVTALTLGAAALQLVLLAALIPSLGGLGAALAHALPVTCLYASLALDARRDGRSTGAG